MKHLYILFFLLAVCRCLSADEPVRERIEWIDIWVTDADKDDLPRVLLVGDSITRGYFGAVEKYLAGKAYCARLTTSKCVSDPTFNDDLKLMLIVNFTTSFEKQPMSDGMILRSGALEESVTGLRKLAALGSPPLPAPNWSYRKQANYWSDEETEVLKRAQQMLRDYGQILVDEGLLAQ